MKRRIGKLLTIGASSLALFGLMGCDETTSTTTTSNITTTNTIIPTTTTTTGGGSSTTTTTTISTTQPAQQEQYFEVKYDTLGHGTSPKTQAVDINGKAVEPSNPKASGWKFKGWYTDQALTTPYDFNNIVNSDITLYAKWKEYKGVDYDTNKTPTIYLAGDSTVQTYADEQYIGGWGQYFSWFFDEEIKVVNAARGGRSSRSFINEDRLFTPTDGAKYSFSENGGKSIEDTIEAGDYLFVQFGHNDDDTKNFDDTSYKYERMVPLGTPDENGIYPVVIPQEKASTSSNLPADMSAKTKTEIAKYGATYYEYGEGTYKGYLKMYIDFARSKGATPVLCTPVARVSFDSNGKIQGGEGRHGEDFAYVKAVKQLAEEENCLLIDNFTFSKNMLETATKEFSDFMMAIVPNDINNGAWPTGYDSAYKNTNSGYQKMEGTHYNKYGAYLTACYVADSIIKYDMEGITVNNGGTIEYFDFVKHIMEVPYKFINPSNRLSISKANEIESLFEEINPTDPNRKYVEPDVAIKAIDDLKAKGSLDSINSTNWETWVGYCALAREVYESLNYDLRAQVTNYNDLLAYEEKAKSSRPQAIKIAVLSASQFSDLTNNTSLGGKTVESEGHTFTFVDNTTDNKLAKVSKNSTKFELNQNEYSATTAGILLGGNKDYYVEFEVTGKCEVTIVGVSGGSDNRTIKVENKDKASEIYSFEMTASQTKITNVIENAGTFRLKSAGSNIYMYYVIIEYYE
ncbi:MAG: InlB B-repeat-containing protein [Acholeplasmatales bacterium]|nr:InlB B-repeat-containing protein [Acholeplasmatales bacterium]